MKDSHHQFSKTTVILHWAIAIGMIGMLIFGLYLESMPRSPDKGQLMGLHKSFGVLILVLAIVRIYWRHLNKFPVPLSALPQWQALLSKVTHWVLLIGTLLMPISGIMMSMGGGHAISVFGWELISGSGEKNEMLSQLGHIGHSLGSKLLMAFILLHIVGAIKHQVMDKDGTISRMLGKKVRKE